MAVQKAAVNAAQNNDRQQKHQERLLRAVENLLGRCPLVSTVYAPSLAHIHIGNNQQGCDTVDSPPLTCTFAAVYKKTRYLSDASQIFIRELKSFCDGLNRWY